MHPTTRKPRDEHGDQLGRFGLADVHMHTHFSDGTGSVEEVLAYVEQATPLDVIAITDHDTIEGALRAQELAARRGYRFEVIVGEEISTREGHLLALFLQKRVPPHLSIEHSIELVHAQGGLAIVAHPFNRVFRFSVQRAVMDRLLRQPEVHPDGIESLNGSFAGIGSSQIAMRLARSVYPWSEIGASDAHTLTAIGCAHTLFIGTGAQGLREALRRGETMPQGSYWRPREYLLLASHYLAFGRAGMYTGVYSDDSLRQKPRASRDSQPRHGHPNATVYGPTPQVSPEGRLTLEPSEPRRTCADVPPVMAESIADGEKRCKGQGDISSLSLKAGASRHMYTKHKYTKHKYTKHKQQRAVRAARLREAAFGWSARAARRFAVRQVTGDESGLLDEIGA
jgi:hypothetical protein